MLPFGGHSFLIMGGWHRTGYHCLSPYPPWSFNHILPVLYQFSVSISCLTHIQRLPIPQTALQVHYKSICETQREVHSSKQSGYNTCPFLIQQNTKCLCCTWFQERLSCQWLSKKADVFLQGCSDMSHTAAFQPLSLLREDQKLYYQMNMVTAYTVTVGLSKTCTTRLQIPCSLYFCNM